MEESLLCSNCKRDISIENIFCTNCGYPENGSVEEKDKFEFRVKLKQNVVKGAEKKIKSVKILLYVIAAINFLIGLFLVVEDTTFVDGLVSLIASLIYICCVLWVNKQPLTGVLAAFGFWILTQLSVVLIDPTLLFNGIILKIIFISIFIKGITSAKDAQKYRDELLEMNAA